MINAVAPGYPLGHAELREVVRLAGRISATIHTYRTELEMARRKNTRLEAENTSLREAARKTSETGLHDRIQRRIGKRRKQLQAAQEAGDFTSTAVHDAKLRELESLLED
ncbi:hypothetical protein [Acrocarpospora sp. B8E8]|uniref:hypothetical protein n=1 Tax=Acrocarpospora sp. B8E8 TaxID=3153572 RepID=UPI00325DE70D